MRPICKVLPIAPSTYHAHAAQRADPGRLSPRAKRDEVLKSEIRRVFEENFRVYGVRKLWRQLGREGYGVRKLWRQLGREGYGVRKLWRQLGREGYGVRKLWRQLGREGYGVRKLWRQLGREGTAVARCTVARLMKAMGLQGAVRGRPVRTTVSDKAVPCPLDRVNRQFRAPQPNVLWVSDFTYVATWTGFVYVAFVIDAFARRIVGWRVSRTAHASFVLDALEQALHERRPVRGAGLVHHSDRGVQYVSIKYTERLAEAGIEPSVGSVGDSYDNALAETINGLFKAEVIHRRGPWRSFAAVEFATLEWVDWFNHRRLLEPIGNIPPAEAEARYYEQRETLSVAA
jgi:putative transposase